MDGRPSAPLQSLDVPKLELDDLIDQLVERAQGVQRAQGRLRALLHAIETVSGDLALEAVLRNVVEAACELAGARHGALGVIGYDGGLEQFIHVGMDAQTVARIGHLPKGRGLLGALITDPRPIRLQHMSQDDRSTGFPDGHPPMDSFLGVPVRVRGEVFGNLYLTDSRTGRFSAEDEELVGALALAAGTAVSNGRLLQESRLQQRWLTASVEISAQLLAPVGEDPLRMIARRAIDIADADLVTVGLLTQDADQLMIEVAAGAGADELLGRRFDLTKTLAGRAIDERSPLLLSSTDADELRAHEASVMDAGPLMVLPLEGTQRTRGVLSLVRASGRRPFSGADLAMAAGFASHASIALELADARAAEHDFVMLEDRERIARDLHDHVIQELFAIGLSLQNAATQTESPEVARELIQRRVGDIDRTIRQIRTSIFELRGPLDGLAEGTRQRILEIAADLTPALGFSPGVTFSGLIDTSVPVDTTDDIAAVVREALTNVAKHAHAASASVSVSVSADTVALQVTDDGVGCIENPRLSGLANLRTRAELRGGTFDVSASRAGGTTVTWKAPLR
jgi:signal transduction histidine kinase